MFSKVFSIVTLSFLLIFSLASCSKKETAEAPVADTDITDFPQQARMMESALKADPKNVNLLIQIGNLYYDWGQDEVSKEGEAAQPVDKWGRAVGYYQQALAIDPTNVNVRVDMANLMRYTGQPDQAVEEYRKAIKQNPQHPQARINLILALGQIKQDYKGAIAEYDDLLKAIPAQKGNTDLKKEVQAFKEAMKEAKK
ncbi:MAG: tetratricopeptide repeat protein [Nitrospirota bacterium]